MLLEADSDDSGTIDFPEFLSLMTKAGRPQLSRLGFAVIDCYLLTALFCRSDPRPEPRRDCWRP